MGRTVRMVPADWEHPKYSEYEVLERPYCAGRYKPLLEGYSKDAADFLAKASREGLQEAIDYFGRAPDKGDYMPEWTDAERTHFMMYETTSEGTPMSPAFPTPEALATWLADTGASSFASYTATYDQWLQTIRRGWAPSAVMADGRMESGVAALAEQATGAAS